MDQPYPEVVDALFSGAGPSQLEPAQYMHKTVHSSAHTPELESPFPPAVEAPPSPSCYPSETPLTLSPPQLVLPSQSTSGEVDDQNHQPQNKENIANNAQKDKKLAKTYKCKKCNKKFARHQSAKNHCKDFSWNCEVCGMLIHQSNNVARHKKRCGRQTQKKLNGAKTIQATSQEITCIFCGKVYKNRNSLKSHINNVHKNEKDEGGYKCERCDFQCNKEGYLKKHIKINHSQSTRLNCDECEFSCLSKSGLGRHINLVHKAGSDLDHEESDVPIDTDEESDVPVESDEESDVLGESDVNRDVPNESDVPDETVERILSFSEL